MIHPPFTRSTHSSWARVSRVSHVFVDVDAAPVQVLTFLLRAGNGWVTTSVEILHPSAKIKKGIIDKIQSITSIHIIKAEIIFFTELINAQCTYFHTLQFVVRNFLCG